MMIIIIRILFIIMAMAGIFIASYIDINLRFGILDFEYACTLFFGWLILFMIFTQASTWFIERQNKKGSGRA